MHTRGPATDPTLTDTAVDVFVDHPTLALAAMLLLMVFVAYVIWAVGNGISEVGSRVADAIGQRWPTFATPGARWRADQAQRAAIEQARDERRFLLSMVTVMSLARR